MAWPEMRNVDLETFKSLDADTRSLVLRMLESPSEADHAALAAHPNCKMLASWLLALPAFATADDESDE